VNHSGALRTPARTAGVPMDGQQKETSVSIKIFCTISPFDVGARLDLSRAGRA
jgi:hypothetical protein